MGKGEYVMEYLAIALFVVSLTLVIVSIRLFEATTELKRLQAIQYKKLKDKMHAAASSF